MKKELLIQSKIITLFIPEALEQETLPVIILNTFDESGEELWLKTQQLNTKPYILATISGINWNQEMSPWYMEKLFKSESDYTGQADEYIEVLTNKIIPQIDQTLKDELNINLTNHIIAGYSLAGLFAIYSLYKTNIFSSAISCSGSLWYPGFIEYIENNELKAVPNKIYFSLGNKESKTRNELMSKVEEKTKYAENFFRNKNIQTVYEENEGNHFQNVIERIAKGIDWILK